MSETGALTHNAFSKSKRSLSATLQGLTLRRSSTKNSKHASSERINSVSSRVSQRFGFEVEAADTVKPARIVFRNYFKGAMDSDQIALQDSLVVRALKSSPGAAVARWSKFKGNVSLGQGRIRMEFKKSSKVYSWIFEVGMIKNIGYKRKGAKDFTLTFHNIDKVINLVCESNAKAEEWLLAIFAEIRVQARVFDKIFRASINDTWKKVFRLDKFDGLGLAAIEEEPPLTPEEEKGLVLDDATTNLIESCLREEIDMYTLCRGKDHPDVIEGYERLAIWLKRNFRHQECAYWEEVAEKGRVNHGYRMKHEMNPGENTMKNIEDSALDELRNPSGMLPLDKLHKQREQNAVVNMDKRVALVRETLEGGSVAEGEMSPTPGEVDPFEDLL